MSKKNFFIILIYLLINIQLYLSLCQEDKNFCTKCNPVTKLCEKCEKNILIPDNNGGCKGIEKCIERNNYCLECDLDNTLCNKCENNLYPDENGGCSYITNCEISYNGHCLKCKDDFILIGNNFKFCKYLFSEDLLNCQKINTESGLCEKCKEGFYLTFGDKKCIKTENCEESSYGLCTKCGLSYYLDKSKEECILKFQSKNMIHCQETLDGINCDKCDENSYFNEEGKCMSVKYCSKEGNYSKCIKCNEGYFLDEYNNSCTKEPKCKYGDKDLGLCLQCINNYYIDFKDGKCKPSINDYIYCVKADQECYQCIQGTFLGEDKKCSLSDNCAESFNGICTHCINSEYHLDKKNYCTNIEKCIDYENYYNFCKECETGFYFNSSNGICLEEIKNFENCRYTNK